MVRFPMVIMEKHIMWHTHTDIWPLLQTWVFWSLLAHVAKLSGRRTHEHLFFLLFILSSVARLTQDGSTHSGSLTCKYRCFRSLKGQPLGTKISNAQLFGLFLCLLCDCIFSPWTVDVIKPSIITWLKVQSIWLLVKNIQKCLFT